MNCNSNTTPLPMTNGEINCNNGCVPKDINIICKQIIIPYGQNVISVQDETNSSSRTFIIPRVTEEGIDLSNKTFNIITINSANQMNKINIENPEILENYIKLKWILDNTSTSVSGALQVQIEALSDNFNWKTYIGTFEIMSSINVDTMIEEVYPSILSQLQNEINILNEKMDNLIPTITFNINADNATVIVKDSNNIVISPKEGYIYKLEAGTYNYEVSAPYHQSQNSEFIVSKSETININLLNNPSYRITFQVTPSQANTRVWYYGQGGQGMQIPPEDINEFLLIGGKYDYRVVASGYQDGDLTTFEATENGTIVTVPLIPE